jgi:hypothetical protein
VYLTGRQTVNKKQQEKIPASSERAREQKKKDQMPKKESPFFISTISLFIPL